MKRACVCVWFGVVRHFDIFGLYGETVVVDSSVEITYFPNVLLRANLGTDKINAVKLSVRQGMLHNIL